MWYFGKWLRPRFVLLGLILAMVMGGIWLTSLLYFAHTWRRNQIAYHSEMAQLEKEFERRLREQVSVLEAMPSGHDRDRLADQIFDSLRLSRAAGNSREVDMWERKQQSFDRTNVALKWAKLAAEEAAYEAALHDRWRSDYERHGSPRHITADEIKPPDLPDDWKWK
jgi:hypothetical protein